MSLSTSSRRRRSHSRPGGEKSQFPAGLGLLVTTALLAVILITGPIVLGAARLWIDLPLCVGIALLLIVQGLRLALQTPPEGGRRIDAIDWSVILFVAYTIVRWLTSPTEYFSRIEMLDVVGYGGIFLTCRYGLAHRHYAVFLLYLLVLLGVGETVFGGYLSNNLNWFPFGPTEQNQLHYAPRWLGTYGCPNHYGSLLVLATGAALALGCFSRLAWPVRIICFYLAFMILFGIRESGSRGAWIALLFAIAALLIWSLRHGTMRWWIPVTSALVLTALAVALFSFSSIVRQRSGELVGLVNSGNLSTYVRVELARDALHIARDHPLFGTGPATFEFIHPRYQDNTFAYKAVLAHDDYLNCLDDYGLIGFALALFFVAAVTLKFFRPLHLDQRWHDRVIAATGFAAWLALLAHSFVDFNLHIPANARLLFALTGLALGRFKDEPQLIQNWSTLSLARLGPALGLLIIILGAAYGAFTLKTALSDITYEQASNRAEIAPAAESIALVQQALASDPANGNAWKLLGDLHRYKASRQRDIQGRIAEGRLALLAYQKAAAANPLDDTILALMGRTFDLMRRYPEAYLCYRRALIQQPYNGEFWFRLGNHYWVRGMPEKAEQAYLLSAACPHGADGSQQAEAQLRQLPEMQGLPLPPPGTNPLSSPPENPTPPALP
jgi:O-antigen ligase